MPLVAGHIAFFFRPRIPTAHERQMQLVQSHAIIMLDPRHIRRITMPRQGWQMLIQIIAAQAQKIFLHRARPVRAKVLERVMKLRANPRRRRLLPCRIKRLQIAIQHRDRIRIDHIARSSWRGSLHQHQTLANLRILHRCRLRIFPRDRHQGILRLHPRPAIGPASARCHIDSHAQSLCLTTRMI